MTTQIKRRRGTTTQHTSFTGAEGELTIDTTKDTVVVHDGITSGGHPLAKESAITGKVNTAGDTMTGDLSFGDNDKAIFGAGSDLQIYSNNNNSFITESGSGSLFVNASNLVLRNTSGEYYFYGNSDGAVNLYYDNAAKLATTSTGVDITGTAVTDGLTVAGNVSVDGGTIKLDGNYPVGTNNVALGDNALYSNTTGAENVTVGAYALDGNTTGGYNTAIGTYALGDQTTGSSNVAVGRQALKYNTTGSSNTALGREALNRNTTASNSTAVGYQAGYSNQTGEGLVAIGSLAGYSSTAGQNIAIGHSALYATTTGTGNVAVGSIATYGPMRFNTTGSSNTALGAGSLASNTTANNNTAVGYKAGYANTTGAENVFLGYQAGKAVTTGSYQTIVGGFAGQVLTTGTNNTLVGDHAGDDLTTGSYNCFVGARTSGSTYPGGKITTGSKNTILGSYNGNQGGLDIRTRDNHVILSDGDGDRRFHAAEKGTNIYARKDNRAGGWSFGANIVAGTGTVTITLAKVPTRGGNDEVMFMVDCISVNAVSAASGSFLNGLARIDTNGGSESIVQPTKTQCGNNPGTVTLQWDKTSSPYLLQAVCVRGYNYQQFMFQTSFVAYDVNVQVEHGADLETG